MDAARKYYYSDVGWKHHERMATSFVLVSCSSDREDSCIRDLVSIFFPPELIHHQSWIRLRMKKRTTHEHMIQRYKGATLRGTKDAIIGPGSMIGPFAITRHI